MERSASCSSQGGLRQHGQDQPTPPWEQRSLGRVPYMSRNAQPLSDTERQALQSLWAANDRDEPDVMRPRVHQSGQRSFDGGGYSVNQHDRDTARSAPPFTAVRPPPPPPPPPVPASTPRHSPTTSQTAKSSTGQSSPSHVDLPPTPPPDPIHRSRSSTLESLKSTTTSSLIPSPATSPPIIPRQNISKPPGTLSTTRNPSSSSSSSKSTTSRPRREDIISPHNKGKLKLPETMKPLGTRLKLAMKDIFKREPIDESQLEHISDRHWTEE